METSKWVRDPTGVYYRTENGEYVAVDVELKCPGECLTIDTPGPLRNASTKAPKIHCSECANCVKVRGLNSEYFRCLEYGRQVRPDDCCERALRRKHNG